MKSLYLSLVMCALIAQLYSSKCAAQDHGGDVVNSLVQSMSWLEKAWQHSFELKVSRRLSTSGVAQEEYRKIFSDNHLDAMKQLYLVKNASTREWAVSRSYGASGLDIDSNNEIKSKEYRDAVYTKGSDDGEITYCRLPQSNCSVYQGNSSKLLDELFGVDFTRLPITVIEMERTNEESPKFLDFLVDFCLEPTNKQSISKTEELVNGTTRIVYRIKVRQSEHTIYGIRIIVSQSGVDQGLINAIHFGYLKKEEFSSAYISEEQLQPYPRMYAKTEWTQLTLEDSNESTIVVPKKIVKRDDTLQTSKASTNVSNDFEWKPLSDESKQKITLEDAKKRAQELAKDIDKILNR